MAAAGIPVITYNFMPVNDWTRTSLSYKMPDGSLALYFNWVDLAVFDMYILKRKNAELSYPDNYFTSRQKKDLRDIRRNNLEALADVVMAGIPGEKKGSTQEMLNKLAIV